MRKLWIRFRESQKGAGTAEYVLLMTVLAVAIWLLAEPLGQAFQKIATATGGKMEQQISSGPH